MQEAGTLRDFSISSVYNYLVIPFRSLCTVFLCRIRLMTSISSLGSVRALVSQHLNQDWYFYSCFVSQNLLQLLKWWQNKDETVPLPPPKPSSPREPFSILLIFTGPTLGLCSVGWRLSHSLAWLGKGTSLRSALLLPLCPRSLLQLCCLSPREPSTP